MKRKRRSKDKVQFRIGRVPRDSVLKNQWGWWRVTIYKNGEFRGEFLRKYLLSIIWIAVKEWIKSR
jgi:hypothetical protein